MSQKEITSLSKEKGYYVDKKSLIYNKKGKSLIISTNSRGYASFNIRIKGKNPTRSFYTDYKLIKSLEINSLKKEL